MPILHPCPPRLALVRPSLGRSLALSCASWLAFCAPALDAQTQPVPGAQQGDETLLLDELARRGARIGDVEIVVQNVFNTDNPDESKRLYHWANRVHMTTRESVIEDILLFERGDVLDPRVLAESARLLRSRDFLVEAIVEPSAYDEAMNTVDLKVTVRDGWSLSPEIKLGRSGGENELGLGVEENNLLGTGKSLTVSYSTDVDRDEAYFGYSDPNVLGSRTRLDAVLANASDGGRNAIAAGRPFFALDTRWSVGGAVFDEERVDSIYDLGETVDEFEHIRHGFSVEGGWSHGLRGRRALRWLAGFVYEHDQFEPTADVPEPLLLPPERKLAYPWVGLQLVEDDFRVMTELNDIGRTEDVPLGLNVSASIGFSSERLGADRHATLLRIAAQKGWEPAPGRLLLVDAAASTRRENGRYDHSIASVGARYYHRNLENHLFLASFNATATKRLDPEHQVLLGGDNGLRGYPLRYQSGEHSAVLTLEQRFFTDWYPFRLFRVGYAVFFDAGRIWGEDPRATSGLGMLYDVGVGLRLTSPRSSSRQVVHIDLASPIGGDESIDDVQLTIGTKRSF